jgi:hypothetical protein
MQNTFRYLAAKKIKQIKASNRKNTIHKRHQYSTNQMKKTLQQNNIKIKNRQDKGIVIIDKNELKHKKDAFIQKS